MSKFSILHISDLHKMEGTSYDALLQSLLTDRDACVEAGMTSPRYIVVSGDLIHGGDTVDEIRSQYAETKGFLEGLVREFLDDDKQRLIIVPGNHDVSFPHTRNSMVSEPEENNVGNLKLLRDIYSGVRWNWKDFAFYKIADQSQYEGRFELFKEFYDDFYGGFRTYPANPQATAECYPFPDDKVSFSLFNSCRCLDHLNDTADIDDDAIVAVTPKLRSNYNQGYLNIAVWHHHFYGLPRETNYMNREVISKLSHSYVQMGLFGHQHVSQVAEFYGGDISLSSAADNQPLLLVSSGTLFGGKKVLPDGCRRQYNVIEVTMGNGTAYIKIHVREDSNLNVSSRLPIWTARWVGSTGSIETSIKLKEMDEKEILAGVLRMARSSRDYQRAYMQIEDMSGNTELFRKIRSEIIRNIKDNGFILSNLAPKCAEDYMLLMTCAIEENDRGARESLKHDPQLQAYMGDPFIKEMYEKL